MSIPSVLLPLAYYITYSSSFYILCICTNISLYLSPTLHLFTPLSFSYTSMRTFDIQPHDPVFVMMIIDY
jgi:hypothetical protein